MEQTLLISRIQHFSTGDGDGIRTTVFLSGCNLHCPWCHNPETVYTDRALRCGDPELIPREMTPDEIADEVLADEEFYRESGGGLTVSGGEPLLQAEKLLPLLSRMREAGISAAADTAGNTDYREFALLNPYIDEYLFDVKTADPVLYAERIGGDLNRILGNLSRLIAERKKVRVRIPIIPAFNDTEKQLLPLRDLLREIGAERVELIPFHRMAQSKYSSLGLTYAYENTLPPDGKTVNQLKKIFLTEQETTV